MTDVYVQSGGERYVKFAKERLAALGALRADLRLPVMRKHYVPVHGVRIDLESSVYGDRIRIFAGKPDAYARYAGSTNPVRALYLYDAKPLRTFTSTPAPSLRLLGMSGDGKVTFMISNDAAPPVTLYVFKGRKQAVQIIMPLNTPPVSYLVNFGGASRLPAWISPDGKRMFVALQEGVLVYSSGAAHWADLATIYANTATGGFGITDVMNPIADAGVTKLTFPKNLTDKTGPATFTGFRAELWNLTTTGAVMSETNNLQKWEGATPSGGWAPPQTVFAYTRDGKLLKQYSVFGPGPSFAFIDLRYSLDNVVQGSLVDLLDPVGTNYMSSDGSKVAMTGIYAAGVPLAMSADGTTYAYRSGVTIHVLYQGLDLAATGFTQPSAVLPVVMSTPAFSRVTLSADGAILRQVAGVNQLEYHRRLDAHGVATGYTLETTYTIPIIGEGTLQSEDNRFNKPVPA